MAMKAFKLGCYLAFFTAALHMIGAHIVPAFSPAVPSNDFERQMLELMQTVKLGLPGAPDRTMFELMNGFSLLMSLHFALTGGIGIIIARRGVGDALLMKAVARTFAATYIIAFVISLMDFFVIPSACAAAVALAFTIASVKKM